MALVVTTDGSSYIIVHDGAGSSDPSISLGAGSGSLTTNGNRIVSVEFLATSGAGTYDFVHNTGSSPVTAVWTEGTQIQAFINTSRLGPSSIQVTGLNTAVQYRFKFVF